MNLFLSFRPTGKILQVPDVQPAIYSNKERFLAMLEMTAQSACAALRVS